MTLIQKIWYNRKNLWKAKSEIVRGWYYYLLGKNQAMVEKRLNICQSNVCGYFDRFGASDESFLKGFQTCADCGCPLRQKVSDPKSSCPKQYWNEKEN